MIKKFYELQETWRTDVHTVRTDGKDGHSWRKQYRIFSLQKWDNKNLEFWRGPALDPYPPTPPPLQSASMLHIHPAVFTCSSVAAYTTLIMYPGYICVQYTIFGCILNAFDIEIQNHFGRYSSHNQTVTIARHTNNHRASYHRIL